MKFFIHHHPPSGLKALEAAQVLIAEYETRNKWLEIENMRLIGLAYPLNSSPKTGEEVMTHEDQLRAIDLADAAGRAMNNGLLSLAEKLTAEAEKLLRPAGQMTFEEWCAPRKYSLDRYEGEYISEMTQELHDLWVTAGGVPVK